MKKKLITLMLLSATTFVFSSWKTTADTEHAMDVLVNVDLANVDGLDQTQRGIPLKATSFLSDHFSGIAIRKVKVKKYATEAAQKKYEVKLINGVEVDFNSNGDWLEVDGNHQAIPNAILPKKIARYIKTNYPNSGVEKIEKESTKYEVELLDGLDLEFDLHGNFLRID